MTTPCTREEATQAILRAAYLETAPESSEFGKPLVRCFIAERFFANWDLPGALEAIRSAQETAWSADPLTPGYELLVVSTTGNAYWFEAKAPTPEPERVTVKADPAMSETARDLAGRAELVTASSALTGQILPPLDPYKTLSGAIDDCREAADGDSSDAEHEAMLLLVEAAEEVLKLLGKR